MSLFPFMIAAAGAGGLYLYSQAHPTTPANEIPVNPPSKTSKYTESTMPKDPSPSTYATKPTASDDCKPPNCYPPPPQRDPNSLNQQEIDATYGRLVNAVTRTQREHMDHVNERKKYGAVAKTQKEKDEVESLESWFRVEESLMAAYKEQFDRNKDAFKRYGLEAIKFDKTP